MAKALAKTMAISSTMGWAMSDPIDRWPAFASEVRARLETGRVAYGDKGFHRSPDELLAELQQEALDLAGWGYVLFARLEGAREALRAAHDSGVNFPPGARIQTVFAQEHDAANGGTGRETQQMQTRPAGQLPAERHEP